MQKQLLLLLCTMASCVKVYASENEMVNQKDYTEYRKQQELLYHAALISALSGKDDAIEEQDQKNKQANEDEAKKNEHDNRIEEENRRKELYDGTVGYFGSQPTTHSEIGRRYSEIAEERKQKDTRNVETKNSKDKIWQYFSENTKRVKVNFNTKVLPKIKDTLEPDRYFICKYCVDGLKDCGGDAQCYEARLLSSTIFTNPDAGTQYEWEVYKKLVRLSAEHDVLLTSDQIKAIAESNPATKKFFKELQDGIKELSNLREEFFGKDKKPILEVDIKKNQNDQGALSQ